MRSWMQALERVKEAIAAFVEALAEDELPVPRLP